MFHQAITCLPRRVAQNTTTTTTQCRRCLHRALSKRPTPVPSQTVKPKATPITPTSSARWFQTRASLSAAPKSKDRGPASKEDTQTDFSVMDILSNTPPPTTAIDACMDDGFALNNGSRITQAGVLLVGGEALQWRPWIRKGSSAANMTGKLRNSKGQFDLDQQSWGVLDLVWPKPDLLIVGTGASILPLSPETRNHISQLGIRVEVQDTRNAAAQFNLLATERGVNQVVAALIPIGWKDSR
ncbi:nadh dehydrogenase [Acrodontium crateriforme]|uniref:NADH dehydrogenase [ubiquinone] 1 alpha subcomplex assembly factor 3 n=1 Tax=Acrodontium crateriforme TaxID=150365 RepID=A0AAQ3M4I8_9PEZI|nr:nadh dehydrogenase [Acrodontium crateriforme]